MGGGRIDELEVILAHGPIAVVAPQAGDALGGRFLAGIEPEALALPVDASVSGVFCFLFFSPNLLSAQRFRSPRGRHGTEDGIRFVSGVNRTFRTWSWSPRSRGRARRRRWPPFGWPATLGFGNACCRTNWVVWRSPCSMRERVCLRWRRLG